VEGEVTYFIRQKDFQKLRNYPIKTFWPYILLPSRGRHKEGGSVNYENIKFTHT
jgi:hypothetical protein